MTVSQTSFRKKAMRRKNPIWLILVVILILGGGSAAWYYFGDQTGLLGGVLTAKAASATTSTTTYQTGTVRRGSITLETSGAGTLVAARTVDLHFSTSGTVATLNTTVGSKVNAGDVLATLSNSTTLEAAVAKCELDLLETQQTVSTLYKNANVSLAAAYQAWVSARSAYNDAVFNEQRTAYARCSKEVNTQNALKLERARQELEKYTSCCSGSEKWIEAKNNYDTALANYNYCIAYTEDEKVSYGATSTVAAEALKKAEETYNTLKKSAGVDPDALVQAEMKLKQAELALKTARENLAGITLIAPISGTVTSIAAGAGEMVGTSTFITIADMSTPYVEVSVDESDLLSIQVGYKAVVSFDAFPNVTFEGKVVRVEPQMDTSGNYQVVKGLIQLDADAFKNYKIVPLGLTATAEIISSEATNVLLVPVDALRNLGNNEYAVFVVGADNKPRLRTVEVGLKDSLNAEIRSGLQEGEVVTTGVVTVKK